jgi:hypothetical protein
MSITLYFTKGGIAFTLRFIFSNKNKKILKQTKSKKKQKTSAKLIFCFLGTYV